MKALPLLLALAAPVSAETLHVAPTGRDTGSGSAAAPFRTITRALAEEPGPGDVVQVAPGTYVEQVEIRTAGSLTAPFTLRGAEGALIRPPRGTYSTLTIRANHVVVEGFDIVGGDGHAIDGEEVHHVTVRNNRAHDSGGSGISFHLSEFQTIEGNTVWNNARTNAYQTSGISVSSNINLSRDKTFTGYRTVIRGNTSHDNMETRVPGPHTDGNGIIIDWLQNEGTGHPPYTFPTLVESNLVYRNGGKGIQVYMSDNVTVRGNTAFHNNLDRDNPGTERGEITVTETSAGAVLRGNLALADPSANPNNTAFSLAHPGVLARGNVAWPGVVLFNGAEFAADNRVTDPRLSGFSLAAPDVGVRAGPD